MKRILILDSDVVLTTGIELLLRREAELFVMRIIMQSNFDLVSEVKRHHPDVLILDESTNRSEVGKLLASSEESPDLRVVMINSHSDRVTVFDRHVTWIANSGDLVHVVADPQPIAYGGEDGH